MKPDKYWLGVDLGGSSVKAVAVGGDGGRIGSWRAAFDPDRPLAFAEAVRATVRRAVGEIGGLPEALTLSAPGLPSAAGDAIAVLPGRLPGLEGLVWREWLQWALPAPVINDAQAALLGESWLGAARGARDVVLLTLGTGVGGAALCGGRLLVGHSRKAGHFGHLSLNPEGNPDICGTPGSLEDAIGNHNIVSRSNGRFATTHELVAAHLAGDPWAAAVWMKSVRALAAALASLGNALDPEVAVVGGGIADAGSALFDPLRSELARFEWRPSGQGMRLEPATLGDLAGAFGCAAWSLGFGR